MTAAQTKAKRRQAVLDKRYKYRRAPEIAAKRLARAIEKEKAMRARKGKRG